MIRESIKIRNRIDKSRDLWQNAPRPQVNSEERFYLLFPGELHNE